MKIPWKRTHTNYTWGEFFVALDGDNHRWVLSESGLRLGTYATAGEAKNRAEVLHALRNPAVKS